MHTMLSKYRQHCSVRWHPPLSLTWLAPVINTARTSCPWFRSRLRVHFSFSACSTYLQGWLLSCNIAFISGSAYSTNSNSLPPTHTHLNWMTENHLKLNHDKTEAMNTSTFPLSLPPLSDCLVPQSLYCLALKVLVSFWTLPFPHSPTSPFW